MTNAWRQMYLLGSRYLGDFQTPLYPLIFLQSTPFPLFLQAIAINMTTTGDYINLERVGNTALPIVFLPKICFYKW